MHNRRTGRRRISHPVGAHQCFGGPTPRAVPWAEGSRAVGAETTAVSPSPPMPSTGLEEHVPLALNHRSSPRVQAQRATIPQPTAGPKCHPQPTPGPKGRHHRPRSRPEGSPPSPRVQAQRATIPQPRPSAWVRTPLARLRPVGPRCTTAARAARPLRALKQAMHTFGHFMRGHPPSTAPPSNPKLRRPEQD